MLITNQDTFIRDSLLYRGLPEGLTRGRHNYFKSRIEYDLNL